MPEGTKYSVCPDCGDKTVAGMYEVCRDCGTELVPAEKAKKKPGKKKAA